MRPRFAAQVKEFGYEVTVEDFRTALIDAKQEGFPEWGIEDLTYHLGK